MDIPDLPIRINFEDIPEAKNWTVGKTYRVKLVVKQIGASETGADFEIIDATSLEPADRGKRFFLSEGGSYKS